jgi:hypothetical protein
MVSLFSFSELSADEKEKKNAKSEEILKNLEKGQKFSLKKWPFMQQVYLENGSSGLTSCIFAIYIGDNTSLNSKHTSPNRESKLKFLIFCKHGGPLNETITREKFLQYLNDDWYQLEDRKLLQEIKEKINEKTVNSLNRLSKKTYIPRSVLREIEGYMGGYNNKKKRTRITAKKTKQLKRTKNTKRRHHTRNKAE